MTETEIRAQCVMEIADGFLTLLAHEEHGVSVFSLASLSYLVDGMLPVFEKAKLPKASTEETK